MGINPTVMKKYYLLILCGVILILFCACEKNKPTTGPNTTGAPATDAPAPTETPITSVPVKSTVDTSDFFEVLRILGPGTIVETKDMSEDDIKRCFYVEDCAGELRNELQTAGLFKPSAAGDIVKLRALYKSGEQTTIGEMYVSRYQAKGILDFYYSLFNNTSASHGGYGTRDDFIHEAELKWKQVDSVYLNNRYYYYLDVSNK